MRRLRVLLDANVLVDAQVRDLFLTLAEAELVDVRWSAEIVEEMQRALVERLEVEPERVERLVDAIAQAFPGAEVDGFDHLIDTIDLPDPGDRHVLAAAFHDECDFVVTFNEKDFPDEVAAEGDVQVLTPDEAVFMLANAFSGHIPSVIESQVARLKRPSLTMEEFLGRLERRAPIGAVALGAALGMDSYKRILENIVISEPSTSAQGAVNRLIKAVEHGEVESTVALVDVELARRLTGQDAPSGHDVHVELRKRLGSMFTEEEWGMATAHRPHSPDVEIVKVGRGPSPAIVKRPQLVEAHLFYMRLTEDGWLLVELDGPDPALAAEPPGAPA